MAQDAYTLNYLCKELNIRLQNSRVNKIVQVDNDKIVFTLYTGAKTERLLIDINPGAPRIGLIKGDMNAPLTAPNFCMLLRKHLLSARLNEITLIPFDRIVKITFIAQSDFFADTEKTLYVELMGRYSNAILTANGKVLGGNRGINMFDNGIRPLIVGKQYDFPPSNGKIAPKDISLKNQLKLYDGKEELFRFIFNVTQGIALDTAREIELTFYKQNNEYSAEKLFEHINKFVYGSEVSPVVYFENGLVKDVCVYPFESINCEHKRFDGVIEAEEFYFEEKEKNKNFKNLYTRLNGVLTAKIKKSKKKLSAITSREKECLNAEENKIFGELILANIYKIKTGDKSLTALNYYDNKEIKIDLLENLSPSQNAEKYYKKYNKQKRTLISLKPQKEDAEKELEYLNSALSELEIAENVEDLKLILEELIVAGLIIRNGAQKKKKEEQKEFLTYGYLGFTVKVGKNNAENDRLTGSAKSEDVWLHVKDYHSSHVIIESNGKTVLEEVLKFSAEICAYYSKCRDTEKAEVVYTLKKHVKKPPKSPLGFCVYDNFKSITVNPNKHTEYLKNK